MAHINGNSIWNPIETAPFDRFITVWHKVYKTAITGTVKPDGNSFCDYPCFVEKTMTHYWPMESFSHWREPVNGPPLTEKEHIAKVKDVIDRWPTWKKECIIRVK